MVINKILQRFNVCKSGLALLAFIVTGFSVSAQQTPTSELGSWVMYFGQIRIHDKWSLHAEGQYRDYAVLNEPEQILLRGGVNYHINANALLTAGYGRITNYPDDGEFSQSPSVSENRIWQQFLMRNTIWRINFEHRYRLEQRWIKSNNDTRYLDRARYLVRLSIPINKKEIVDDAFFLSCYNEIFVHFSSSPFDRNRLYGAMGYQFLPNANVQAGYLAQTVNTKTKHYLQLGITYNIDLRKKN